MEVGGAYVRIRPYVTDEDARALAALEQLARDVAGAFDRFRDTLADTGEDAGGAETDGSRMAATSALAARVDIVPGLSKEERAA